MNKEYAKEIFEKLYQQVEEETKNQEKQNHLNSLQILSKLIRQQSANDDMVSAYSYGLAYRDVDDRTIFDASSVAATLVTTAESGPRGIGLSIKDELVDVSNKLSLDELIKQALELGYSLQKIEYESTDLTGTNKIKLKD